MAAALEVSVDIAAPQAEVFAAAADVSRWAERVSAITKVEMLTDGPIGEGTRFRETRKMFGKEASEEMEFREFDPPNGYVLVAESHGSRYRSGHRFAPADAAGATRVTMFFEAEPLTFFAKVMSVLLKPMMKMMIKQCGKDLEDLKASIEAERGGAASPAGG